jgi:hypothetical protein
LARDRSNKRFLRELSSGELFIAIESEAISDVKIIRPGRFSVSFPTAEKLAA